MIERDFNSAVRKEAFLLDARINVNMSSPEEVTLFMQEIFPGTRKNITEEIAEHKDLFRGQLCGLKLAVKQNSNEDLSRPGLCSNYALMIEEIFEDSASQAFDAGNRNGFRFWFDLSVGMNMVLVGVIAGDSELSGSEDKIHLRLLSSISDLCDLDESTVNEEVRLYLQMTRESKSHAAMLLKDPSGFSIIDNEIERIRKGEVEDINLFCPEYVLAGAELARGIYRELYKIAEPLYPREQKK